MKKTIVITAIIVFFIASVVTTLHARAPHQVDVNFKMVEKGISWLEFINTGAEPSAVKDYFMTHVAPTAGCKSIIRHWARFMEWNNEIFYEWIAKAIGLSPTKEPLKKKDGTLTSLGNCKKLWTKALKNTEGMKKHLKLLKDKNLKREAIDFALKNLPPGTTLKADFHFVLFGYSTAFSIGNENGYDFLQLSLNEKGNPDVEELVTTMAHELHHTGVSSLTNLYMKDIKNKHRIILVGVMTAEGMATYLIDRPFEKLEAYKKSRSNVYRQVAKDWEKHSARIDELYKEAERDIRLCIEEKADKNKLFNHWLGGVKGAAYILGSHLLSVIDKHLGRDAVLELAKDYRYLLQVYNKAAAIANKKGEKRFIFDSRLADLVANID
jgi:hypothetical protein